MTESEWLDATDPTPMLDLLRARRASDRRLRLFAVACCRRLLRHVRVNSWDERAVDVAERFADGQADVAELREAAEGTTPDWTAAYACREAASPAGGVDAADYAADNAAWEAGSLVDQDDNTHNFRAARDAERVAQAALLRDIFGNPFRSMPSLDLSWLKWHDGTVVRIAEGIYQERAFERMGILHDALVDAGCDNGDILSHCCEQGVVHVKGCWVVDLLLRDK